MKVLLETRSRWKGIRKTEVARKAKEVLGHLGSTDVELSILLTGDEEIRQINAQYRNIDASTDVLAFAMLPESSTEQGLSFATPPDGIKHLGEVIICYPQAVKQAGEHLHSIKKEMAILIIHGVLHLLGYDHGEPEPARQMAAREAAILKIVEGGLD